MVKKTSILTTGLIVGGSILALAFLSKRFDVGGVFLKGVSSIANTIGQGVGLIPGNIAAGAVEGGARGFGEVGKILPNEASPGGSTNSLGFDFETALQNLRDNISLGGRISLGNEPMTKAVGALEIAPLLTESAISRRIEAATQRALERPGQAFGGFESAQAQETALQRAIRESKEKFPQFFK